MAVVSGLVAVGEEPLDLLGVLLESNLQLALYRGSLEVRTDAHYVLACAHHETYIIGPQKGLELMCWHYSPLDMGSTWDYDPVAHPNPTLQLETINKVNDGRMIMCLALADLSGEQLVLEIHKYHDTLPKPGDSRLESRWAVSVEEYLGSDHIEKVDDPKPILICDG